MKICILSHEFEPFPGGGIATYHNTAARVLAAAGHEVHFVTNAALHGSSRPQHALQVWREGNLTVHRLPNFDERRRIPDGSRMLDARLSGGGAAAWASDASHFAALQIADYLRGLHAKVRLDVIESPEFFAEAYYVIRARRSGRTAEFPPVVIHGHTSSRLAYRLNSHFWDLGYFPHRQMMAREEYCLRNADGLLVPSHSLLRRYEADFGDALPSSRVVAPYFFEVPDQGALGQLPAELDATKPYLLCVGRLEPRKGSDLAVRAFRELGRRHPELRLVFLGREMWHPGERFEDVLRTYLDAEATGRVQRLGNVPREQVLAVMARCAAFLHPAPWDNYPCATLEAMGAGALCVVSDHGGHAEMVEDGVSGRLHRTEDVDHLIEVVDAVLGNEPAADAMRAAARQRARAVSDRDGILAARDRLFEAVVAGASAAPGRGRRGKATRRVEQPPVVVAGVVVIDACGASEDAIAATFPSIAAALEALPGWRVSVLADRDRELTLPDRWSRAAVVEPPTWSSGDPDAPVLWLVAGVTLLAGRLQECLALASSSSDTCGAFPWLEAAASAVFPFSPDFAAHDLLVEGRVLPPAFVARAGALRACRTLEGMPTASVRLASLLAAVAADGRSWFRHTADVAGHFLGDLPVVTADVQCRALGFLDALGRVEPSMTLLGATREVARAVVPPSVPTWLPSEASLRRMELRESAAGAARITTRAELAAGAFAAAAAVVLVVDATNWFDLVGIARAGAAVGVRMDLDLGIGEAGLANVPLADLVAAYQTLVNLWPQLSGEHRPAGLLGDAHGRVVSLLRDAIQWRVDRVAREGVDGDLALRLPDVADDCLASEVDALRFWRSFLAAQGSPAFGRFLDGLGEREDLPALARDKAWVRVLLQHRLWQGWHARSHEVLAVAYARPAQRQERFAAETAHCTEAGLAWWLTAVRDKIGLERAWGRRRPFRVAVGKRAVASTGAARVTVVIPSFRHEHFIEETVRSALAQTGCAVRVLVVDDRSPDRTLAVARGIADERLEVRENQENLGLGNSVLQALQAVDTEFVALLNSDDIFHPNRLRVCCEALATDPDADLVCTDLELVDREGRRLDEQSVSAWYDGRNVFDWVHWYARARRQPDEKGTLFRQLLRRNFLVTSSNLVCRTAWLRAQSESLAGLKYCLDWQLFLTAALRGRLRFVAEPLLAYRLHPTNTVWFDRASRWAYSLEVNRVAITAVRNHAALHPPGSMDGVTEALRDLEVLRDNTEVDWPGMLVNGVLGGQRIDDYAAARGEAVEFLRALPQLAVGADGVVAGADRRLRAEETRARVLFDEVYNLHSRLRWQTEHSAEIEQRLAAGRRDVDAAKSALATSEQQVRQLVAARDELVAELAARAASQAEQAARLENMERSLAAAREEFAAESRSMSARASLLAEELAAATKTAQSRQQEVVGLQAEIVRASAELAALRAQEAALRETLSGVQGDLAVTRGELAAAIHDLGRTKSSLATTKGELEVTQSELEATKGELEATNRDLEATKGELGTRSRDLARRTQELAATADQLSAVRAELAQANKELATTGSQLAAESAKLAAAQASRVRLRQEFEELRGRLHSERRDHVAAGTLATEALDALARELAALQSEQDRVRAESWSWRGYRIQPGAGTRGLLRRLRKLRRKWFGSRASGTADAAVDGLLVVDPGFRSLAPDFGGMLDGVRLHRVELVDANLATVPADPADVVFYFPERTARHVRRLAARHGADAVAWHGRIGELAESLGTGAPDLTGDVAQLAVELAACRQRRLVVAGSAVWCARMSMAAALVGCPWTAIVAGMPKVRQAALDWAACRLREAPILAARSQVIADALVASGVAPDRLFVPWTAPQPASAVERIGDVVLAVGRFDAVAPWEACVGGFLTMSKSTPALRLQLHVDTVDGAGDTAAGIVVRELIARDPGTVAIEPANTTTSAYWSNAIRSLCCLVWVGERDDGLIAPPPILLAAMAAGVPIVAWDTASSRSLFGSLGGVALLPSTAGAVTFASALAAAIEPKRSVAVAGLLQQRVRELTVAGGRATTLWRDWFTA